MSPFHSVSPRRGRDGVGGAGTGSLGLLPLPCEAAIQCFFMPPDGNSLAAAVERLRDSVRQMLKCVMEAEISQLITETRSINADITEAKRLDVLIALLKNFNGPIECHEWPYPLLLETDIDKADIALINVDDV